ncbi:MAG: O-methyltransferase [Gemmataceae bacterium]
MNRRTFVGASLPLLALGAAATAQPGSKPGSPEKPPLARDDAEKKILDVLDDLDKNQRRGNMNVPLEDARLLRLLAEFSGAKQVVELGTSNGYSGIWFCLALRKTGGKLTTFDIDEGRIKQAKANFKRAGVSSLITLVEGDAHENVKSLKGPIDLVFIDADKPGYPDYLTKLLPLVRPGGVIAAHNMARPKPDPRYVEMVTTNKDLETIFLNMDNQGIALSLKKW